MASTAASHSSFHVGLPGPCEHKADIGCMLSALPCCCSCADRRQHAAAYPTYVDGEGMIMKGRRWQRYCRRCHDFWQSIASDSEASASSEVTLPTPSSATTSTIPSASPDNTEMPRTNNSRPRREFEYSVPVEFPLPDNDSATQSQHSDTRSNQRRRRRQNNADHGHPASTRRSEQHFPLGTREDVQQDDYVSPIFGMFNRAWGRYRDAEDARQAARQVDTYQTNVDSRPRQTQLQQLMEDPSLQRGMEQMLLQGARAEIERNVRNNTAAQDVQHDVNVVPQNVEHPPQGRNLRDSYVHRGDTPELTSPPRLNPLVPALPLARSQSTTTGVIRNRRGNFHAQFYSSPFDPPMRALDHRRFIDLSNDDPSDRISAIDRQRSRPEPSRPEDLKVDFGCKSCQEQKIDSISMPCMHASMCHWCAEIWKEACRTDDGRFDRSLWTCPICRRQISEMRRFYI